MLEFSLSIPELEKTIEVMQKSITNLEKSKTTLVTETMSRVEASWEGDACEQYKTNIATWETGFNVYLTRLRSMHQLLQTALPEAEVIEQQANALDGVLGGSGGSGGGARIISLERSEASSAQSKASGLEQTDYADQKTEIASIHALASAFEYASPSTILAHVSTEERAAVDRQEKLAAYQVALKQYATSVDELESLFATVCGEISAPEGYDPTRSETERVADMLSLASTEMLLAMHLKAGCDSVANMLKAQLMQRVGENGGANDWDIYNALFPDLTDDIQHMLDNDLIGKECAIEKEATVPLPDGSTLTYEISFTLKNGDADLAAIQANLTKQNMALSGTGWKINSDGEIELGDMVKVTASSEELKVGVKVGADVKMNEYTTLHATEVSIETGPFGVPVLSIKTGLDTETDDFEAESTLTIEKPFNSQQQLRQEVPQLVIEPVPVPVVEEKPWYEKGWDWVCEHPVITTVAVAAVAATVVVVAVPGAAAAVGAAATAAVSAVGTAITSVASTVGTAVVGWLAGFAW